MTSRMTATDELRRLLDERGVEWQDFDDEPTWMGSDGEMHYARQEFTFNGLTGNVTVYHLTPEQAVEATLGRGECRLIPTRDKPRSKAPTLTCSKCGWWTERINDRVNYCPNCGRKVMA